METKIDITNFPNLVISTEEKSSYAEHALLRSYLRRFLVPRNDKLYGNLSEFTFSQNIVLYLLRRDDLLRLVGFQAIKKIYYFSYFLLFF